MASITHNGRGNHAYSVSYCIESYLNRFISECTENELEELSRDLMWLIYLALNNEYDHLTSDETVKNELTQFNEDYTKEGRIL